MMKVVLMNKEASDLFAKLVTEIYKNEQLQQKVNQLETNRDEAIEYLTSYEAIHTIQFGVEEVDEKDLYNNKGLDEKTITEMTNRYLKVHDKLLSILERGKE
jgi:uncharacterized protein YdcH (DUF465 family)